MISQLNLSSDQLRAIIFSVGLLTVLLSFFWPRNENGQPKKGRAVILLGLILGIAAIGPARALQKQEEKTAAELQQTKNAKDIALEETLRKTDLKLQEATIELENLRTSASLERRADADREAADHKAFVEMASDFKRTGDVLKLYFDESRSGLTFDKGKKDLTCNAKEKLAKIAIYLLEERNLQKITIVGHTDHDQPLDDPNYNQRLSEARAIEVVNYLQNAGVPSKLLVSRGVADRQPAGSVNDVSEKEITAHNQTDQQKALNRRVEIDIQQAIPKP